MIRVLVAEDSLTYREFLMHILGSDPEIKIVGWAKNGREAITRALELKPDVVTMDIQMPLVNGIEATSQIMTEHPTPIVIVSGIIDDKEVDASLQALEAGALAVLPKPSGPEAPSFQEDAQRFIDTVKNMSKVRVVTHWHKRVKAPPRSEKPTVVKDESGEGRVVVIAASTGGPKALFRLLGTLPPDFPVPILIVQHISKGFTGGLATWLERACAIRVKTAENGERLKGGTVYLAPENQHMGVTGRRFLSLSNDDPIRGFRPSGDYLFRSVAKGFGAAAVGVILTGMGEDGVDGLRDLRKAGSAVIAQDKESSIVFGMPAAAIDSGLADYILPLDEIGARLMQLVSAPFQNKKPS